MPDVVVVAAESDSLSPRQVLSTEAAAMPRRVQVPSSREQEIGAEPNYVFVAPPPAPSLEKIRFRSLIGASFRSLNPRGIAGNNTPIAPLVVFALLAVVFQLDATTFPWLLFFIKGDLHLSLASLNALLAVAAITTVAAGPFSGWLADRWSRVWMTRIGSLLTYGALIMAALAPGAGLLMVSRALVGFGPGISEPAKLPLLSDYYPVYKRARVFAFLGLASAIGGTGLFVGVILLFFNFNLGWRPILFGIGFISLGLSLLLFVLREPIRGEVDRRTLGVAPASAPPPLPFGEAWRTVASIKTLRRIWYAQPFLQLGYGIGAFLFFIIQTKLGRHEFTGPGVDLMLNPRYGQVVLAVATAAPLAITIFALSLSAPLGAKLMRVRPGQVMIALAIVPLVQAASFVAFVVSPIFLADVIFAWIGAAAFAMVQPIQNTLLSAIIPARTRGLGFQSISPFMLIGFALQPGIGLVADQYGINMAIGIETVLLIVGAVVVATGSAAVDGDIRAALAASLADQEVAAAKARGINKLLVCRDVDVTYDSTTVLFHVNLDIEEGELVALLGTNGAGKSTLLRAICGVQPASNGAIFLDGEDVTHKSVHRNARDGVVYVPGGRAIFPTLTVAENLRTAAWLDRAKKKYINERVDQVLGFFPILRERWEQQAGELSGGEQQMLALGQAFCMRPRLLMIDELSLGLAPAVVERLLDIVRAVNAAGTTVVLVEQSVNVALTVARRAVFMNKGEIQFDGPTATLLGRHDLVRSVFLGGAARPMMGTASNRRSGHGVEAETVLSATAIGLNYGGVRALDGVSFEVRAGEVLGIIGPNGAGKTSLFDILSGVSEPGSGEVFLQATDVTRLPPDARARLGLIRSFQDAQLFPSLTVQETIAVALERKLKVRSALLSAAWMPSLRKSERRAFRRVEYLIDLLRLGAYADKFVSELSTGTRRLVDLACALAAEPRVLLLDEPSSGLAQGEVETLGPTVRRLALEAGCGVLCIEHDIPLITHVSDRLLALELGVVIASGSPQEVMRNPRVIAAYLNASDSVIRRSGGVSQALQAAIAEEAML